MKALHQIDLGGRVEKLFVATNGDDRWSGRLNSPRADGTDGPFATLTRARDAVRELKAAGGLQRPVEVQVRGGTYYMSEPLSLGPADSGTPDCPITYRAYPGERPVLSGGRLITGWKPYKGEIMCCSLPRPAAGKWQFRQLFFNGERQIRARCPNFDPDDPLYGGWAFVAAPVPQDAKRPSAFRYEPGTFPRQWAKPTQAEVFIMPGYSWLSDIIPIKEIDRESCTITLTRDARCSKLTSTIAIRGENRFYVENVLEELDMPGEWCLDSETDTLYFWPPGDPDSGEVVAPVTERLVELHGTADEPISHINIAGFTFAQTRSLFPPPDPQYKAPNSGWTVHLEHAEDCSIEDNLFDRVGGDGIGLQEYNARNRITGNEIAYPGAYGISVASFHPGYWKSHPESSDTPPPADWHEHPEDHEKVVKAWPRVIENVISRNHIHHTGVIERHGGGIVFFGISSVDNVISHNSIHHTSRAGISTVSGFGRVTIEYNELHHLCLETADVGGFYSNSWYVYEGDPDLSRGNIIRHNIVRDVIGAAAYEGKHQAGGASAAGGKILTPYYGWAVYFDNGPMDVTVYGNILVRNTLGGIMISNYGKNVVVENNVIVDSEQSQMYVLTGEEMFGNRVARNIFYYTKPDAALFRFSQWKDKAIAESDNNVFFHAGRRPMTVLVITEEETFERWRKLGYDEHSLVGDPKFVDPARDNYDLQPDSPALRLGFEPIDATRIGLEGRDGF